MIVTKKDIEKAAIDAGIEQGDILLVHSSYKSLGEVDGGAETVIQGFLDALGCGGTLVLPTFCQKDFSNVYTTWNIDKPSDTGYLTNYFRKREGSLRSDQATHSVAASGRLAYELTKTHGHTHKLQGSMGDTPFSNDSPWEKMYQMNAKILLLGVTERCITFRHYAEYIFVNECIESIKDCPEYESMKERLQKFGVPGVWPHVSSGVVRELLEKKGAWKSSACKNTTFMCVEAKQYVDIALKELRSFKENILLRSEYWDTDAWIKWTEDLRKIQIEAKGRS